MVVCHLRYKIKDFMADTTKKKIILSFTISAKVKLVTKIHEKIRIQMVVLAKEKRPKHYLMLVPTEQ